MSIISHSLRVQSIGSEKMWWQEHEVAGHIAKMVQPKAERNEFWCLDCRFLLLRRAQTM